MGGAKHLTRIEGEPMLSRVVTALRDSRAGRIAVVLRPGDGAGERLARGLGVEVRRAERIEQDGRAASVRAAVGSARPEACGLLIALADQPWLRAEDFDALLRAFESASAGIVRARFAGSPGTPVVFARGYFEELASLAPGEGGRAVIARHPDDVAAVDLDAERGRDLDRPADLA